MAEHGQYDPKRAIGGHLAPLGKPKADPVFDGWLNHHLSQLYDPVIDEPIPAELLRLLEERLK